MTAKKVMLVDDMNISNEIMKRIISNALPQTMVFDFTLPEKALNSLTEINPDIIFLDLNMPKMNGWEFLDVMTAKGYRNKVFILTSSSNEADMQRSLIYLNVISFIVKPILPADITHIFEIVDRAIDNDKKI